MIIRAARSVVTAAALGAAAVPIVVPAAPAAAATTHIGIVVRLSSTSTLTNCVNAGGSGLDVLTRGFPNTQIGSSGPYAGFVLKINAVGQNPPDNTHYWSYWHSAGTGTWTYSGVGAGSYTPRAGTVEGWSYVSGQSDAAKPPRYTYAQLCASADPNTSPSSTHPPTHAPTRTARPTPKTSSTPAVRHTAAAQSPTINASPTPTALRTPTRHPRTSPHPRRTLTHHRSTKPSGTRSVASAQPTTPAPAISPSISNAAVASARSQASSGSPAWGTVVAILVILALGGGAWLRLRRRPE
ncbi:MAG TPA: hypothetical protein VFE19_05275 [Jatrophihabitantaceae bacterium]|nr:hypothetical protein [Jatrophihabitantaceae bacterium]